jgi:hypothetical protein
VRIREIRPQQRQASAAPRLGLCCAHGGRHWWREICGIQLLCRAVHVVSWLECAGGVRRAAASCCQPNEAAQLTAQRPQLHAQLLTSQDDHALATHDCICTLIHARAKKKQKNKKKKTIRSVRMRAPPTFQTTKTARQKTYMNISPPACRRRTHRWMGNEHDSGHRLCATTTHAQPSVCSSCAQPQQHTTRSARRWVCPHGFRRGHAHLLSGKSRTYRWNEQPWREALAAASLSNLDVRPQSFLELLSYCLWV